MPTPFTHAISVDSTVPKQGWGGQLNYLGKKTKPKKPYHRCQKVIMLEEGDQNIKIVKNVVKGYGDLASIQWWG
jgi:hypothetical protein